MTAALDLFDPDAPQFAVTEGTMRGHDGHSLPHVRTDVAATITGPFARVTVRQWFRNEGALAIEAVYHFPLPEEASVHTLRFRIEDRVVEGVVKPRDEARRDYERALEEGRVATLLEEDRPTVFSLAVANVAPGATIEVELGYQDLLPFDDGRFRFLFPMSTPIEYREVPSPVAEALAPPRKRAGDRSPNVAIRVTFPEASKIQNLRSVSHLVRIDEAVGEGTLVCLRTDGALANRDFELDWQASDRGVRPWMYLERKLGEDGTFLLVLTPSSSDRSTTRGGASGGLQSVCCGNCGGPVRDLEAIREIPGLGPVFPCGFCGAVLTPGTDIITVPALPRDVLILVDRSASMRGSEVRVREAVRGVLAGLLPGDSARVEVFDHERISSEAAPNRFVVVSPELIAHVDALLALHKPRGGSEFEDALATSGSIPAREGRTRVVVLISDVAVGNQGKLLRRLPALLGTGARLFVLGVGEALDRRFAARLARKGGGAFESLAYGPLATEAIERFSRRVREAGPVLTDLKIWWDGADASYWVPDPVPDLYSGEALHVLGRFRGTGSTKLVISGLTSGKKPFRQELSITLPEVSAQAEGLGRAWAQRSLADVTERIDSGPEAGNGMHGLLVQALTLSRAFSLLGRWTAFIAEERAASVAPGRARRGVLRNLASGSECELTGAPSVIGRVGVSAIEAVGSSVAAHHAEIAFDGADFVIRDLGTQAGTFVDRTRIREARLREGAVIRVGDSEWSYGRREGASEGKWFTYVPTEGSPERPERERMLEALEWASGAVGRYAQTDVSRDDGTSGYRVAGATVARWSDLVLPPQAGLAPPPAAAPQSAGFGAPPPFAAPMPRRASRFKAPLPAPVPPGYGAPGLAPARPEHATFAGGIGGPPPMSAAPAHVASFTGSKPGHRDGGHVYHAVVAARAPEGVFGWLRRLVGLDRAAATDAPYSPDSLSHDVPTPVTSQSLAPSESYSAQELAWLMPRIGGAFDLVFLVDATASMGRYIDAVRKRLLELLEAVRTLPLCRSLRIAVVAYRDHPPEERTYVTQTLPLTDDLDAVNRTIEGLSAVGGGDGPEAVTDGLVDVVRLDWRADAAKAVVWFGDAPPHGVEPDGDSFASGCPCGRDWYAQAESCREMGIAVFPIGCLPTLHTYVAGEEVYKKVAETTRAMYLPLEDSESLVPLIVGAAECALDGQRVDAYVVEQIENHRDSLLETDMTERVRWLTMALRAKPVRVRRLEVDASRSGHTLVRGSDISPKDVRASLERLRAAGWNLETLVAEHTDVRS